MDKSGIKKSSKHKQRLYEKCLKTRNQISELEYKNFKNLFETMINIQKSCIIQNELVSKKKI